MYAPAPHDEITGLVNYLEVQLSAIRAAPLGLTEEQARATPCRSALSVGGIVKHTAYGLRGDASADPRTGPGADGSITPWDDGPGAQGKATNRPSDDGCSVGVTGNQPVASLASLWLVSIVLLKRRRRRV